MDLSKNAVLRRCGYDDPVEIILVVTRVFEEAPHARRVGRDRIEIGARPACDRGVDEGFLEQRAPGPLAAADEVGTGRSHFG